MATSKTIALRSLIFSRTVGRKLASRSLSTAMPPHRSLIVEKFGDPTDSIVHKVRKPEEIYQGDLNPKQVLVEHLAACINPADINMIQGVYGIRPTLPMVVGNEGVLRVKEVGSQVRGLQPGDIAIGVSLIGYWQSYSIQEADDLFKIDPDLDVQVATQLKVNPCTAYRMMKDFHELRAGDVMIQNGANSAVGVYAIQLAKHWGIKTINVIRERPGKELVINELNDLGADYVITDEQVGNVEVMSKIIGQVGKPKLLLNCVGGKNAVNCQRHLDQGGYSVTYGAMSKQPFGLSATSLIFKDHRYVGFWVSRWYKKSRREDIEAMLAEVTALFKKGALKSKATKLIDFDQRDVAFKSQDANAKYIFSIDGR